MEEGFRELEDRIQELKVENEALTDDNRNLSIEVGNLKDELKHSIGVLMETSDSLSTLQYKYHQLQAELVNCKNHNDNLQRDLDEARNQIRNRELY